MKIEIDDTQLVDTIVKRVVEQIKPLFNNSNAVNGDELLNVQELADYLKVNKSWVYDKVHTHSIPFQKAGKFPRFRKKLIDKWLENSYSFTRCADKPLKGKEVKLK